VRSFPAEGPPITIVLMDDDAMSRTAAERANEP
jgi:hypothetical protein